MTDFYEKMEQSDKATRRLALRAFRMQWRRMAKGENKYNAYREVYKLVNPPWSEDCSSNDCFLCDARDYVGKGWCGTTCLIKWAGGDHCEAVWLRKQTEYLQWKKVDREGGAYSPEGKRLARIISKLPAREWRKSNYGSE